MNATNQANAIEAEFNPESPAATQTQVQTHKKPTAPTSVPLSQISVKLFPMSIKDSFKDYFCRKDMKQTQEELLSTLPFYPEPSKLHSAEVVKFESPNSLVFPDINEFHVKPRKEIKNAKHLVIIHGYGAGLGFFIKNVEDLAERHPNWHIHAIDLPGYGCSSRVRFPYGIPTDNYKTVEKLFTVPLRDWFDSHSLNEKNTITVAHSMGGYLSLALQINEVNKDGYLNDEEFKYLKPKLWSSKIVEKFENQKSYFKSLYGKDDDKVRRFWDTLILVSPGGIMYHDEAGLQKKIPSWFAKLWNMNISPFSLVRNTGPFGPMLVSGWTSRRFALPELFNERSRELMHNYTYSIFNARGSGEYMLNYFLAPGAFPRNPMVDRISDIKKFGGKMVWLYGSHDWMDYRGGVESCEKLAEVGSGDCRVEIVPHAGHHIYLDSFEKFNDLVSSEMVDFEKRSR